MEQKSMTALISAFARAYHAQNNEVKIYDDRVAHKLLTEEEYAQIAKSMSGGIAFFNPAFVGEPAEALRWVVDHQLSPAPLGRAAYAEKSLQRAVAIGARQYLIFGAGYDTFAYCQPDWADRLEIFEIDHPLTASDKRERVKNAQLAIPNNAHYIEADFTKEAWQEALSQSPRFDPEAISFCTMLGVAYYLSKPDFTALLCTMGGLLPKGSSILFDYPDQDSYTDHAGQRAKKQSMLAGAANEKMLASYAYGDMQQLLCAHDFLIYEHLTPKEMTEQYFNAYNRANPLHTMTAFDHVNYCLAVKR